MHVASRISMYLVLSVACLLGGCTERERVSEEDEGVEQPPNIVYILADDAGYGDIGVYGQERFATPNIDRIAAEGIRFTQHYSGSTVCAPSRSVLMTGRHTGHTYIRGNREVQPEGQEPMPDSVYTLAEMLQEAGYVTGAFGKWGLGYPGSEGDPMNQGFDRFFGYNCHRLAHNYYPRHLWHDTERVILPGNADGGTGSYAPDMMVEHALQFVEDNQHRPFFLFFPTPIPHAELLVPEDSIFANFRAQFDEPKPYVGVDRGEPRYREGGYGSQRAPRAAFATMMTRLDRYVGDILAKLDEVGLDENTIVIFTSDNGPHVEGGADPDFFDSNGPLKGYKRDLYEGGIRVPLIVRWPGHVEAGITTDHVSAFWDVMPTLADIVGIEVPDDIDGISFLPTLERRPDDQVEHHYLYWEFHERGGRRAVRKGRWKAVQYDIGERSDTPTELFDLSVDVSEDHDIAAEHPNVVEELRQIMEEARTPSNLFNFGRTAGATE